MNAPKPAWLKVRTAAGDGYAAVRSGIRSAALHTVCEEARCPNRPDCWGRGTATFLLLGDVCTRGCAFCSVRRGAPARPVDAGEPERVARCAAELGLDHVVLTSVTRDDLPDGGASVFARAIAAIRAALPGARVETLVPDYRGAALAVVLGAGPDVLAHNIEVVRRLTPLVRHGACGYDRSLSTLREAKGLSPRVATKSSLLLGLGEEPTEVEEAMRDLRETGVDVLVIGQYLRPAPSNAAVARYVPPTEFESLRALGESMGFAAVVAEPLARTSFRAAEAYGASRPAHVG